MAALTGCLSVDIAAVCHFFPFEEGNICLKVGQTAAETYLVLGESQKGKLFCVIVVYAAVNILKLAALDIKPFFALLFIQFLNGKKGPQ